MEGLSRCRVLEQTCVLLLSRLRRAHPPSHTHHIQIRNGTKARQMMQLSPKHQRQIDFGNAGGVALPTGTQWGRRQSMPPPRHAAPHVGRIAAPVFERRTASSGARQHTARHFATVVTSSSSLVACTSC